MTPPPKAYSGCAGLAIRKTSDGDDTGLCMLVPDRSSNTGKT